MISTADCIDGSGDGTNETMPWTIWHHSVVTTAVKHGANSEYLLNDPLARRRLARAYEIGEPVWMAANTARDFSRGHSLRERAEHDTPMRLLRYAIFTCAKHDAIGFGVDKCALCESEAQS